MASKKVTKKQNPTPICEFKTQAELNTCLDWWKKKLFLTDWIIKASVVPESDLELEDCCGENLMVFENNYAVIHLMQKKDWPSDSIVRYCQEKILVHELLHCKYNFLKAPETIEGKYMEVMDHKQLEAMAKSLIMVKYNISLDWFKSW